MMKRIILPIVLLLLFSLTACAQTQNPSSTEAATSPDQSETPIVTSAPSNTPLAEATVEPTPSPTPEPTPKPDMTISSAGVKDGVMLDAYGMRSDQKKGNVPTRSLPISIKDSPEETVCYTVVMMDPDSKPLCGYEWVHWLAVGFTSPELSENASIDDAANMIQGKNDFGSTGYGGPTPPDKPHTYIITVYALDSQLELKNGFTLDELTSALDGHILAEATLSAEYSN